MTATILVTGGLLGTQVVNQLLAHGAEPTSIAVMLRAGRDTKHFEAYGVQIRIAEFDDIQSLEDAVQGIKRALLIPDRCVDHEVIKKKNFVDALIKSKAEVELFAYASILRAQESPLLLAKGYKQTEDVIKESALPFTFLRNGWYAEHLLDTQLHASQDEIIGASGEGRLSAASRKDYAEAAAKVLLAKPSDLKSSYELGSQPGYTLDELAVVASKVWDKPIKAVHLSEEEYANRIQSTGAPNIVATALADAQKYAATGALEDHTGDLQALLGRETESIEVVMKATLANQSM
jgi:NAD(P)H dehydrogenase (quinone)